MTWVPVLNLVLTIVFYAMFPVVFPLFLFPQTGPAALKGYLVGFFYLASWSPIYAVLHMFITQYSASHPIPAPCWRRPCRRLRPPQ